jgi:hypothetical protein
MAPLSLCTIDTNSTSNNNLDRFFPIHQDNDSKRASDLLNANANVKNPQ